MATYNMDEGWTPNSLQVILVGPEGNLNETLEAIRSDSGGEARVMAVEALPWEERTWAVHLQTTKKVQLAHLTGVEPRP